MIIGIKEANKVILAFSAFDWSAAVKADDLTNSENVGVWTVKGNPHTIMGCTFPTAESDAFRYEEELFQGEINYDRLTQEIVPSMEGFAEDKEYIGDGNGRYAAFLIAQSGRFFEIASEHVVTEIDSFVAFGNGDEYAKGRLHTTLNLPVMDRIRKAFEFVAQMKQLNCYPISVLDTLTDEVQILAE